MDALPLCESAIDESAQHAYTSRHKGCLHACGHDGYMTMLLGADHALLEISLRATDPVTRTLMIKRIEALASSIAKGFGGSVEFDWQAGYPVTMNNSNALKIVREAIENTFGPVSIELAKNPWMGSEDFSFMLEKVPGAFLFIGNVDSAPAHNSSYDFNDKVIPFGVRFYQSLAHTIFNR